jgi:hypothetical protein
VNLVSSFPNTNHHIKLLQILAAKHMKNLQTHMYNLHMHIHNLQHSHKVISIWLQFAANEVKVTDLLFL